MIEFTQEEKKVLWIALNNLQHAGFHNIARLTSEIRDDKRLTTMLDDWITQSMEEYDLINTIKAKIKKGCS